MVSHSVFDTLVAQAHIRAIALIGPGVDEAASRLAIVVNAGESSTRPNSRARESAMLRPNWLTNKPREYLRRLGFEVTRYPGHHLAPQRVALLNRSGVNLVLDVGANIGQYAAELRLHGYTGTIVSFEPLAAAYEHLELAASRDPLWLTKNIALGNSTGTTTLNVAGNSVSSSLLQMLPAHSTAAPESVYVDCQTVAIRPLDSVLIDYLTENAVVFLKIDTQGYERDVLAGAEKSLPRISGLQLEMSLEPLYAGQMLLRETIDFAAAAGFSLIGLEPGFIDLNSGRLLQCDGVFFREEHLSADDDHKAQVRVRGRSRHKSMP